MNLTRAGGWSKLKTNGYPGFRLLRELFLAIAFFCVLLPAAAQYSAPYVAVTGTVSSANGMPAANYVLTFQPTQIMFVGGTSVVVSNANCATDTNGAVVGIRNPLTGPVVNVGYTGTLTAGNYYIVITWYDGYTHQTLVSPEIQAQLTSSGQLQISPPTGGVAINTVGMDVYIGTGSGTETYQGQTTSPTATYTQSTPLSVGAAQPIFNSTVCQLVANDAAWPIAGYNATLTDPSGLPVPGYPQQWQFLGPGSTYNLSNGLPLYNGRVTYPVPLLTQPYNHNAQSITGSLGLNGYNLYSVGKIGVGTSLPAWGVDVEGAGLASLINANGGYLVNGLAGTSGFCLGSDGTAYDTPIACSGITQLTGAVTAGPGSGSVATTITPTGVTPGTYTQANVTVNAAGQITAATNGSAGTYTSGSNSSGYWIKDPVGHIHQWGATTVYVDALYGTLNFPIAYTNFSTISLVGVSQNPICVTGGTLLTPGNMPIPALQPASTNTFNWHFESNVGNSFNCNMVLSWQADGY